MNPKPAHVVAIYPGSFDPITNGHLDLIERGSKLVDRLIVAVLQNSEKQPLFTVEERMEMLCEVGGAAIPNVEVGSFAGLLVDYAAQQKASLIIRGIRAISDYEFELQMALMNRRLRPGDGDGVSDGRRGPLVSQLASGEGSVPAGRQHLRSGSGQRGEAVEGENNSRGEVTT